LYGSFIPTLALSWVVPFLVLLPQELPCSLSKLSDFANF
jgi:hypothetical protein